ncbi:putative reverse transcriptase domain-containing protein [Tanacetum coccineum]
MVNTRQSTPEFSGLAFDETVQRAVNALLPGLATQITNWLPIRNGAWGIDAEKLGDRFTIRSCSRFWGVLMSSRLGWQVTSWKVMLSVGGRMLNKPKEYFPRSEQQKYEREYHTIRQRDGETSGEFMKRFLRLAGFVVNTKFTDVAQVADATRNIEILRERSSKNNKRNRDGDRIRPTAQGSNQRGYDQKRYDRRGHDRQGSSQRGYDQKGYDGHSQKRYSDHASSPPCDICGKLYLGKACYRATGACFTCGLTGHMARDCPKNGGNGGRGSGDDNQPDTKGRVFSSTKD